MSFVHPIVRPRRTFKPIVLFGLWAAATATAAAFAFTHHVEQDRLDALEKAYWTVTGPPCIEIGHDAFSKLVLKPRHDFSFAGLRFYDLAGGADCHGQSARKGAPWDIRQCMFTSPGVLRIKDGGREAFYFPGIGKPVTITVKPDGIHCILGGNYTIPSDPRFADVEGV